MISGAFGCTAGVRSTGTGTGGSGGSVVAAERYEFAPRAFAEIGWRNLFGKNRSVNLFNSLSLHTKDSTDLSGNGRSLDHPRLSPTGFTHFWAGFQP